MTGFTTHRGAFKFVHAPFGLKNSGSTFVRAVELILGPIKDFTDSYVDDMAVHSDTWELHVGLLKCFLDAILKSGLTLNLKKCVFAKGSIRYVGHILESGRHGLDPSKVDAVSGLEHPVTKKQVRQLLELFCYFRS